MSATYTTIVSKELLPEIEAGDRLPTGFRLVRVVGEVPLVGCGEPPSWQSFYVEFEDDDAPAELTGKLVEPMLHAHHDDKGRWLKNTISERRVIGERP